MSEEVTEQVQEKEKIAKEDNLRRQREHYERQLAQMQEETAQLKKQLAQQSQSKVYDDDDDDEPYVDNKKLNKTLMSFEEKLEKKIEEKAEQKASQLLAQREKEHYLKANPEFNKLMNEQYLEKFATRHPKIAENILRMPDNFERQKLVFETMKELGVDKEAPKEPSIQDKINQNRRSPYYQPSGISNSPYEGQGDFSPAGQKGAFEKMKELQKSLRLQ